MFVVGFCCWKAVLISLTYQADARMVSISQNPRLIKDSNYVRRLAAHCNPCLALELLPNDNHLAKVATKAPQVAYCCCAPRVAAGHQYSGFLLQVLEADNFTLYCLQSLTGTKFILIASPRAEGVQSLLQRYDVPARYVLCLFVCLFELCCSTRAL